METDCGEGLKEIATLVNGINLKRMVTVFMYGQMEIDMKECGILV